MRALRHHHQDESPLFVVIYMYSGWPAYYTTGPKETLVDQCQLLIWDIANRYGWTVVG